MNTLKVIRGSGLTSCLMVRLSDWYDYWHKNGSPPDEIDSSEQFGRYADVYGQDVSKVYLKEYHNPGEQTLKLIDFYHDWQYKWYNEMPLAEISAAMAVVNPFSDAIIAKSEEIATLIGDRTVVLYRGNDKAYEIFRTPYFCMETIAKEIGETSFFVQTDENEFYDFWKQMFPDTVCYAALPRINKDPDRFYLPEEGTREEFTVNFFGALLAISKANKIIMTTGNVGLTVAILRGRSEGIIQYHGTHRIHRKL
jgi:hypothetical protein